MRVRQESVEQTRLQITEATMRLHERLGPAATTVSAIAAEAGVTRLTVYRHFPDEIALVAACGTLWGSLHPGPDTADWAAVVDPEERLRVALAGTYAWVRTAAPMMTKIYRDLDSMPTIVRERLADDERLRVSVLTKGFRARGRRARRLEAALAHSLHVRTWESLCRAGGLTDAEAVDLMTATVLAAATPPS